VPLPFELLYVHDPPGGERTPDLSYPFCHQIRQTIGREPKALVNGVQAFICSTTAS
jgi:hypothetical protein